MERKLNGIQLGKTHEFTEEEVRTLMIQNIMGYNNTQPKSYWELQDNNILLANTGPADRLFYEKHLYYATENKNQIQQVQ